MIVMAPDYSAFATIHEKKSLFLAGTIDMGNSHDWQAEASVVLDPYFEVICNPRRKDWDSSWDQNPETGPFKTQVDWELNHLTLCSHVLFHFASGSKSPITLMELGLRAGANSFMGNSQTLVVSCDAQYERYGNVKVLCDRFNIPVVPYATALEMLIESRQQK